MPPPFFKSDVRRMLVLSLENATAGVKFKQWQKRATVLSREPSCVGEDRAGRATAGQRWLRRGLLPLNK